MEKALKNAKETPITANRKTDSAKKRKSKVKFYPKIGKNGNLENAALEAPIFEYLPSEQTLRRMIIKAAMSQKK